METRSSGKLPRDIPVNDGLETKQDIAALRAEIQARKRSMTAVKLMVVEMSSFARRD